MTTSGCWEGLPTARGIGPTSASAGRTPVNLPSGATRSIDTPSAAVAVA